MKLQRKLFFDTLSGKIFWDCLSLNVIFLASIIVSFIIIRVAQISMTIPFEGLSLVDLIEIILIVAPGMLDLAIPVSVALAGCAIAHKLVSEKGLAALRALGYSLLTPLKSVFLATLIVALIHLFFLNVLRHRANFALQTKMTEIVEENLYNLLAPGEIADFGLAKVSVERRDGKLLEGLKIFTKEDNGINLIAAESALLKLDHSAEVAIFSLKNGVIVTTQPNLEFQATEFSESSIKLPLQLRVMREFKRSNELSNSELFSLLTTVSAYLGVNLPEEDLKTLSDKLHIKHVSPQTIRNKLVSLKKELSRRSLGPLFDIVLALAGFTLGVYLRPRVSQRYFPIAYTMTVLLLVVTLFLSDFLSEKLNNLTVWLSEGYITSLLMLSLIISRALLRLQSEKVRDGLSAVLFSRHDG